MPDPNPLAAALQAQDDDLRRLRAVVAFYADPANWVPRVQRGPGGHASGLLSRVEASGYHRVAAEALATTAPNLLSPAHTCTPEESPR